MLSFFQKARETTNQQQQQILLQQQQTDRQPPPGPNQGSGSGDRGINTASQGQQHQQQCYQCSVCGLQTPQMTAILHHMRKEHGVTTRIKCPLCESSYSDQHGLKRHFRKAHGDAAASASSRSQQPPPPPPPPVAAMGADILNYGATFL